MTIGKALVAAAVLAIAAPATTAFAHDDDNYTQHQRDHREHLTFHSDVRDAHRRAHEEGFYSAAEHRAYHRALRDLHNEFHEDHPGTRHDHYRWTGYWNGNRYGNYYRYRNQHGYENRYGYSNSYYYGYGN